MNDILGYLLHTSLLVPYFSWQWYIFLYIKIINSRSHFVHHSKTNHLTLGETHVPVPANTKKGAWYIKLREIMGVESFAIF